MTDLDLYNACYVNDEEEIFKHLKSVNAGELLPSGGPLGFFYDSVSNPSTTLFLCSKKRVKFFYVDSDDFISLINEQQPHWIIDVDKNIMRLNLIFEVENNSIPLVFNFDFLKDEYRSAVRLLAKKGVFDLYFLSILYGGLVLDKRMKLDIPKSILKTFKSIK